MMFRHQVDAVMLRLTLLGAAWGEGRTGEAGRAGGARLSPSGMARSRCSLGGRVAPSLTGEPCGGAALGRGSYKTSYRRNRAFRGPELYGRRNAFVIISQMSCLPLN